MALPFDFLDSMMYSIVASGILSGIALLRLPYRASSDSIDESGHNLSRGLAIAIGFNGFYLFVTGIANSFIWPYAFSGGSYNILFGGVSALGGLTLVGFAVSLYFNKGLKAISYSAAVLGVYLLVDAYAILTYGMTQSPLQSALLYSGVAAASFLSVPATHIDNKYLRWLFALAAFAFALGWLYFGANVTLGHLKPPAPAT